MKIGALRWVVLVVLSAGACLVGCEGEDPTGPGGVPRNQCGPTRDVSQTFPSDGSALAYTTPYGVRVLDQGKAEHEQAGFELVSWSPDGSLLALIQGDELRVFDRSLASTGISARVDRHRSYHLNSYVSWSPDSRRIGYLTAPDFHVTELSSGQVSVVPVCPHQSDPSAQPYSCLGADWSRSIDRVLVNYHAGSISRSRHSTLQGTDAIELQSASWSPDGRFLFVQDGDDHDFDFRIVDARTNEEVLRRLAPAPDASGIYVRRWEGACHFSEVTRERREVGEVVRRTWDVCNGGVPVSLPPNMGVGQASWSEDGTRVVFIEEVSQGRRRLVTYDADDDARQVRCEADEDDFTFTVSRLALSQDGSAFTAIATDGDRRNHLGLFDWQGEGVSWLGLTEEEPQWSP